MKVLRSVLAMAAIAAVALGVLADDAWAQKKKAKAKAKAA